MVNCWSRCFVFVLLFSLVFIIAISWTYLWGSFPRNISARNVLAKGLFGNVNYLAALIGTPIVLSLFSVSICKPIYKKFSPEWATADAYCGKAMQCVVWTEPIWYIDLVNIMRLDCGVYHLVSGPHGCGMTTALKEAVCMYTYMLEG